MENCVRVQSGVISSFHVDSRVYVLSMSIAWQGKYGDAD